MTSTIDHDVAAALNACASFEDAFVAGQIRAYQATSMGWTLMVFVGHYPYGECWEVRAQRGVESVRIVGEPAERMRARIEASTPAVL